MKLNKFLNAIIDKKYYLIKVVLFIIYTLSQLLIFSLPFYYGEIVSAFTYGTYDYIKLIKYVVLEIITILICELSLFVDSIINLKIESKGRKYFLKKVMSSFKIKGEEKGTDYIFSQIKNTSEIFDIVKLENYLPFIKVIMLIYATTIIFITNIYLGIVVLSFLILYFLLSFLGIKYFNKKYPFFYKLKTIYKSKISDLLKGSKVIKEVDEPNYSTNKLDKYYLDDISRVTKIQRVDNLLNFSFLDTIEVSFTSLFIALPIIFFIDGLVTLSIVITAINLVNLITEPLWLISNKINSIFKSRIVFKEITTQLIQENNKKNIDARIESINISNLSIKYNNNDVLSNFNIKLNKGNIYSFNQKSGFGKTSIIKALLSNVNYTGSIFVNNKYDLNSYYINDKVSYINQDSTISIFLLNELVNYYQKETKIDIKELFNINYSNIESLSSGEKEKLLLAVFLLASKDKDIIILDESFSSLDQESKKKVLQVAQDKFFDDKIVIIVEHK